MLRRNVLKRAVLCSVILWMSPCAFAANPTVDPDMDEVGSIPAAQGMHDLRVKNPDELVLAVKSFQVLQGDPNTRRTVNRRPETENPKLVATVDVPNEGDLLYRAEGTKRSPAMIRFGRDGKPIELEEWYTKYDRGGPRVHLEVNLDGLTDNVVIKNGSAKLVISLINPAAGQGNVDITLSQNPAAIIGFTNIDTLSTIVPLKAVKEFRETINIFGKSTVTTTTVTGTDPAEGSNIEPGTVSVEVVNALLKSVTFKVEQGAGAIHDVLKDDVRKEGVPREYRKPHWEAGKEPSPVCYKKNSTATADVVIDAPGVDNGTRIDVRGKWKGDVFFTGHANKGEAQAVTVSVTTAANALPNEIDHINPMLLSWEYSVDGANGPFEHIGDSQNEVFVIYGTPGVPLHHTVLRVSCANAKGIADLSNAAKQKIMLDKIFDDFHEDLVVLNIRWAILRYYGGGGASGSGLEPFLTSSDGKCGHWAPFLVNTVKVQDTTFPIAKVQLLSKSGLGFMVKTDGVDKYGRPRSVPAQGGIPTRADFPDHAVVKFDGKYYDPSYGKEATSLLNWQNKSLSIVHTDTGDVTITDETEVTYVKESDQ